MIPQAAGAGDRAQHRAGVRDQAAQVDHLGVDPVGGQLLRGGHGGGDGRGQGDQGDVASGRRTSAAPEGTWSPGGGGSPLVASSDLCSNTGTGSSLRMAAAISPTMSDRVEGAAILRPGTAKARFSTAWECWAPKPRPPPLAVRTTSRTMTCP